MSCGGRINLSVTVTGSNQFKSQWNEIGVPLDPLVFVLGLDLEIGNLHVNGVTTSKVNENKEHLVRFLAEGWLCPEFV